MKTITKRQCDGSLIEYTPKYETTSECPECGHISKIDPYEIDIPSFHRGPFERISNSSIKCLACGNEQLDSNVIFSKELERVNEKIPSFFEKDSVFFKHIKK